MPLIKPTHPDHSSDPGDKATDIEIANTEDALERAMSKSEPEMHPRFDGKHCIDCGAQLITERLLLGKIHCVLCQTDLEIRHGNRNFRI